ncbi:hypothetical protein DITRI_Ditri14bG0114700 [Diplodiscus trichospermus]
MELSAKLQTERTGRERKPTPNPSFSWETSKEKKKSENINAANTKATPSKQTPNLSSHGSSLTLPLGDTKKGRIKKKRLNLFASKAL